LLVLIFSSCASIPNVVVCAEINLSKGICTYTVSGKNIVVDDEHPLNGQTWFDMRSKILAVPASSWAQIKVWMIKQCKKTNKCDADISQWDRDINPL
jgi:FKBP-type peptidyl-prolyl cis-trans isomerase 2